MKDKISDKAVLQRIAKNINKLLNEKEWTATQLANMADIPSTTLKPILKGERNFGVTNLISIATALGVSVEELSEGTCKTVRTPNNAPKYLVSFINNFTYSYVEVYDIEKATTKQLSLPYAIFCINDAEETIDTIMIELTREFGLDDPSEIAFYSSVVCYEYLPGREKLIQQGEKTFCRFFVEPDWMNIHKSYLADESAMLLTITNGFAISYSLDNGKTLAKHQGYGFPLADDAGNIWLGCQALRHAINVKEGIEERTLLSDKILALFKSNLNQITSDVYDDYIGTYDKAATIVKELANKPGKAADIIKTSYDNISKHIQKIDELAGTELPIYIAGDLGHLYEVFIPEERLKEMKHEEMLCKQHEYARQALLAMS